MARHVQALDAYFRSGLRLYGDGRLAEAERVYREVLAIAPGHADSLHMLGVIATQCGQSLAALNLLDQAITIKPSVPLFHVNRAAALLELRQLDAALASCQQAVQLKRNCAEAHQVMGHVLSDLGRPDEAIAAYRAALRYKPDLPDLYNNLGLALRQVGRLEDALVALRQAAKRAPRDTAAQGNLAGVLKELGQAAEAEACYRAALRAHPADPVLHLNLGLMLLVQGKLEEGWREYEWRFRADPGLAPAIAGDLWHGDALRGRTLLVHAEQGIGDMIQFCRYLPLLPRDGRLVVQVHRPLVRLISQFSCVSQVVAIDDALPPYDVRVAMMSLPHVLGLPREADIPAEIPYLGAEEQRVEHWRRRTEHLRGKRVGIVWAGNPARVDMDRRRSLHFEALVPLLGIPDVSLVSLQKGEAVNQLRSGPHSARVHDWTDELLDFVDTAALVKQLDLVIGVDTAVVHLAGALGKDVWLLNRLDTCWRWQMGREDSPWYPTLRVFRQPKRGDWASVIARIASCL